MKAAMRNPRKKIKLSFGFKESDVYITNILD